MKYLKIYEAQNEYTFQDWYTGYYGHVVDIKKIYRLNIEDKKYLTSLKGIENFINLEELDCTYNKNLDNLHGIEELIRLRRLACFKNNQTSIKEVRNLINLKKFYPLYIPMGTLDDIEKLVNLEDFECCWCELNSLKGLENKVKLRRLLCYNNNLKNIDEIENLPALEQLACNPNPWSEPLPYKLVKKFGIGERYNNTEKFNTYEYQKEFIEEHPEKIMDLIPIGFNEKLKEEYKDLIEFFNIKL